MNLRDFMIEIRDAWLVYLAGAMIVLGVVLGLKAPSIPTRIGGFGMAIGGVIPWGLYCFKEKNKRVEGDSDEE